MTLLDCDFNSAQAFVLTCIDYRFINPIIDFLNKKPELSHKYDQTALAGASLGFNQNDFKYWRKTFLDQLKLGLELHSIKQVIVADHMDCGAYKLFYPHLKPNSEEERLLHIKNIKKFIRKLKKKYPELSYSGYLFYVDGSIEVVVPDLKHK